MTNTKGTLAETIWCVTTIANVRTIINNNGQLMGIFTDGDLRRALDHRPDVNSVTIDTLMSPGGKTINIGTLAAESLGMMEQHRISTLVVIDDQEKVVGVAHLLSLLRAGLA